MIHSLIAVTSPKVPGRQTSTVIRNAKLRACGESARRTRGQAYWAGAESRFCLRTAASAAPRVSMR